MTDSPIIISAYNRPASLKRLFSSLARTSLHENSSIPLIISIDNENNNKAVRNIAENFSWTHGPKKIIAHKKKLGLRKHLIFCGDLTEEYESIILLEDDVFVSPVFYHYTKSALAFYKNDPRICGIALYSYASNEFTGLPFFAYDDGYDNFFMQVPCTWGQAWTRQQWQSFKTHYMNLTEIGNDPSIPSKARNWPESSWKKYFFKYMVDKNKFFVYPRQSFTTNFADTGTHYKKQSSSLQVNLKLKKKGGYIFSDIDESLSIYDSFFEIKPDCIKKYCEILKDLDFQCDFYSMKDIGTIKSEYLISSKPCTKPIKSYDFAFKDPALNIIYDIPGDFFHLSRTSNFLNRKKKDFKAKAAIALDNNIYTIGYYNGIGSVKKTLFLKPFNFLRMVFSKIISAIIKKKGIKDF